MKEQTIDYVKYILEKSGVKTDICIEALCANAELLEERRKFLLEKEDVINKYQPIFTIGQRLKR